MDDYEYGKRQMRNLIVPKYFRFPTTMLKAGACSGFLAVLLGAFGAHAMKKVLDKKG